MEWFVGRKSDTQFKRLFGRIYHKIPKSRPSVHNGYSVKGQEEFCPRKTQTCLVKISDIYQSYLFADPAKLRCSAICESDFFFLQTTSHSVMSYSCKFLAPELIGQTHIRMQFSLKDYYHLQDTQ
jgi:hypothetical protein